VNPEADSGRTNGMALMPPLEQLLGMEVTGRTVCQREVTDGWRT
jgi:hypothetical protein